MTLAWETAEGARFYNFQLRRDGVKILSTWPRSATLTLPRTWRFAGKRYALEPGVYTVVGLGRARDARAAAVRPSARLEPLRRQGPVAPHSKARPSRESSSSA